MQVQAPIAHVHAQLCQAMSGHVYEGVCAGSCTLGVGAAQDVF